MGRSSGSGIARPIGAENPVIAQLFDNVGLADQAGSGFIRILDEWRELGYRKPNVVSDPTAYQFELELKLAGMLSVNDRNWLGEIGGPWKEDEELALVFARHQGSVDNLTLRSATGQHLFDASQTLRSLRNRDLLVLHGSGRNASYVLGAAATTSTERLDPNLDRLPKSTDHLPDSTGHLDESTDHLDHGEDQTWIDSEIKRIAGPIARTGKSSAEDVETAIVGLSTLTPMSTNDLVKILNRRLVTIRRYVRHLVEAGEIEPVFPQAQHPNQRYRATLKSLETATQTTMPL
jgi:predicted HTH transcriptional regulator